jgi:hypothetical protein
MGSLKMKVTLSHICNEITTAPTDVYIYIYIYIYIYVCVCVCVCRVVEKPPKLQFIIKKL